jgi:hypothetical protein
VKWHVCEKDGNGGRNFAVTGRAAGYGGTARPEVIETKLASVSSDFEIGNRLLHAHGSAPLILDRA